MVEDDGDPWGWPVEGLCLLVSEGKSRPAWKKGKRVLVYGSEQGLRYLASHEKLEEVPSCDFALAERLQSEWRSSSCGQRDRLLRAMDEMEARLVAPRRALAAFGACAGREFCATALFSPRPGDAVRVLRESTWEEALVESDSPFLQVTFAADGARRIARERNVLLVAKRRRRCYPPVPINMDRDWRPLLAKDRLGRYELPANKADRCLRRRRLDVVAHGEDEDHAAPNPPPCSELASHIARCCFALKALARPLAALVEDFGTNPRQDCVFRLPKHDTSWPFEFLQQDDDSPIEALFELADALTKVLHKLDDAGAAGMLAEDFGEKEALLAPTEAARAHAALFDDDSDSDCDASPAEQESSCCVEDLRFAALKVAGLWDATAADSVRLGPESDAMAAGAPCFTTLPHSNVAEPHRTWITKAKQVAQDYLVEKKQACAEAEVSSQTPSSSSEEEEEEADDEDEASSSGRPRRAAGLERACSSSSNSNNKDGARENDAAAMESLQPEIVESLAGGLGADFSRRVKVVTISSGPLAGELGVVAAADIEKRWAIPYAGVAVTDDEIGQILWSRPRAAARWLMYRYEFAPQISVLPYLGCPTFSPAPFINCARGPNPTEALAWSAARSLSLSSSSPGKQRQQSPSQSQQRRRRWRSWGSEYIGLRIRRSIHDGEEDDESHADGTVVAWLDAFESDFEDENGVDRALWRVKYDDDSPLNGDDEDLELHELLASAKAPPPLSATAEASAVKKSSPNCHFSEISAAGGAVVGVYIVASRRICAGEPLLVTYGREFWDGWIQRHARLCDLEESADALAKSARDLARKLLLLASNEPNLSEASGRRRRKKKHEAWRRLVGVPFSAGRSVRGERNRIGAVVGLVVENSGRPESTGLPRPGDRVDGYWRGAAPPFPGTVRAVNDEDCVVDYDDGGVETNVAFDRVSPPTPPRVWRALETLPVGTWVRSLARNPQSSSSLAAPPKKQKLWKKEGVVLTSKQQNLIDVLGDDGTVYKNQPITEWEPLFVVRFADDTEQRVLGLAQLRHLMPTFLEKDALGNVDDLTAAVVAKHPPSSVVLDDAKMHAIDIARALRLAGLRATPPPHHHHHPRGEEEGGRV